MIPPDTNRLSTDFMDQWEEYVRKVNFKEVDHAPTGMYPKCIGLEPMDHQTNTTTLQTVQEQFDIKSQEVYDDILTNSYCLIISYDFIEQYYSHLASVICQPDSRSHYEMNAASELILLVNGESEKAWHCKMDYISSGKAVQQIQSRIAMGQNLESNLQDPLIELTQGPASRWEQYIALPFEPLGSAQIELNKNGKFIDQRTYLLEFYMRELRLNGAICLKNKKSFVAYHYRMMLIDKLLIVNSYKWQEITRLLFRQYVTMAQILDRFKRNYYCWLYRNKLLSHLINIVREHYPQLVPDLLRLELALMHRFVDHHPNDPSAFAHLRAVINKLCDAINSPKIAATSPKIPKQLTRINDACQSTNTGHLQDDIKQSFHPKNIIEIEAEWAANHLSFCKQAYLHEVSYQQVYKYVTWLKGIANNQTSNLT